MYRVTFLLIQFPCFVKYFLFYKNLDFIVDYFFFDSLVKTLDLLPRRTGIYNFIILMFLLKILLESLEFDYLGQYNDEPSELIYLVS